MSEQILENEIREYKEQIVQLDSVLSLGNGQEENVELKTLKSDLEQLLKLTEEALLDLKKKTLLENLNSIVGCDDENSKASKENQTVKTVAHDKKLNNLEDVVASKGRIYFECKCTDIKFHNVVVLGIESYEENTVRVLFCNPTQMKMKTCEHFMNDTCRFNDNCKYSHGHSVNFDDLLPYLEPSYSNIKIGMDCLAKHSDELWYLARIESIDESKICVQFKKINLTCALEWESVLLLYNTNESDEESSDEDSDDYSDQEIISAAEEYNYDVPTTSSGTFVKLGDWEKHTRGIGSKLMAKMGYIVGHGLGKEGKEGRLEPVEAFVLPEGSVSLDKAMELKEKAKMKKLKKNLKTKKNSKNIRLQAEEAKEELDVFEFINHTLTKTKETSISKEPLKKIESKISIPNKGLNIKMLETHNQIQNVEKNVLKLKESLIRNKNSDKATLDQIKQKIEMNEKQLLHLRKAESDISSESTKRKRKSDIF